MTNEISKYKLDTKHKHLYNKQTTSKGSDDNKSNEKLNSSRQALEKQ